MSDSNIVEIKSPVEDALNEVLAASAQKMLTAAVEAEVTQFLSQFETQVYDGKKTVVRNGYLPKRTIQTGLGEIEVQVPKTRDRSKQGIKFTSSLLPPYLKRTKAMEELIPWLYLKGISTGDMQPALESLLGPDAKGLSSGTVSKLKQAWEQEYDTWRKRDLSKRKYVYIWTDGIYSRIRMDDKLCLLVIIGSDDTGRKEVLAVIDGYRESEANWTDVLEQLSAQGLTVPPNTIPMKNGRNLSIDI